METYIWFVARVHEEARSYSYFIFPEYSGNQISPHYLEMVYSITFLLHIYIENFTMLCSFVCLFWVAWAIFQLSGDCHHCRWQGCKFKPMLSAYGISQWGFFYVPHLLRHGTSVFKVISERPMILPSECRGLGEGAITTYFKRLRFDAAGTSGAQTHGLPFGKREHYH
jgi:hypothetical protein